MEITEKQKNGIEKIAKEYNLELVLLFGSQVDGKYLHKESDFDIAYLAKTPLNLEQESRLIINLFPIFESDKVEIANLKKTSPLMTYAIFNNCQVLYQNPRDPFLFPNLRIYAFKHYVETKPLYQLKFQRLREEIKAL